MINKRSKALMNKDIVSAIDHDAIINAMAITEGSAAAIIVPGHQPIAHR